MLTKKPHRSALFIAATATAKKAAGTGEQEDVDAEEAECVICTSTMPGACAVKARCPRCTKASCQECAERFILETCALVPRCMFCAEVFSMQTLPTLFSASFCAGPLFDARMGFIVARERALLTDTQVFAISTRDKKRVNDASKSKRLLRGRLLIPDIMLMQQQANPAHKLRAIITEELVRYTASETHAKVTAELEHTKAEATVNQLAVLVCLSARTVIARVRQFPRLQIITPQPLVEFFIESSMNCLQHAGDTAYTHLTQLLNEEHVRADRVASALVSAASVLETVVEIMRLRQSVLSCICSALGLTIVHAQCMYALERDALALRTSGTAMLALLPSDADVGDLFRSDEANPEMPLPSSSFSSAYVCRCPANTCRGSARMGGTGALACALCHVLVCSECHELLNEGHVCNADSRASVAVIAAEEDEGNTRRCPACMAPVTRAGGCNVMWCTACHTPFNFRTGHRIHGAFHNPEHEAWLKTNTQAQTQTKKQQERETEAWTPAATQRLFARLSACASAPRESCVSRMLVAAHRCCVDIATTQPHVEYTADTHKALRVGLLLNRYNETTWLAALRRAEQAREFKGHARAALGVLQCVGATVFDRLIDAHEYDDRVMALAQLDSARMYANAELGLVYARFGHAADFSGVADDWTLRMGF